MNRYKKLFFDTIIYAVGNFGSRIIGIIMLPLYTYYLTKEDYGLIDLLTTTILLVMPVFSFNIADALLRFGFENSGSEEDKNSSITNSFFIFFCGFLLLILFYPLLTTLDFIRDYYFVFYLLFLFQGLESLFKQFSRSLELSKVYMISDILYSVFLALSNILLIIVFNFGIEGYFYSMVLSSLFDILYLIHKTDVFKRIKIKYINKKVVFSMLFFSLPLIPNSVMWWVMNASNRYFIKYFLGLGEIGIYAVATKFPTIINLLNRVFSLSWQVSAIKEFNSGDKNIFQTKVFHMFYFFMIMVSCVYIIFNRFIISLLVSTEFNDAYLYSPILVIGTVFLSFATFLGTNYVAAKETKGALWTTLFGSFINIILNIILIPYWGLYGASFASLIGYFSVWLVRVFSTKKYVSIKYDISRIISSLIVLFTQLYLTLNEVMDQYIIGLISFIVIFLIGLEYYKKVLIFGIRFFYEKIGGMIKISK